MEKGSLELTQKSIFFFWLPIAATWLMMALEGPFIAAVIARLPELEFNLAAYGIAFSIGLFVEAPIMMLISASLALVRDIQSYRKLRAFTLYLNGGVTLAMGVFAIPAVFNLVAIRLMDLPEHLAHLAWVATILLIPWPAAIGFRRVYQGLLIRADRTRLVAYCTVIRLLGMSLTALILARFTQLPGAWVGCSAMSVGVIVEGLATWVMTWSIVAKYRKDSTRSHKPLTLKKIWIFCYPLALSSTMALGIRPVISFFVANCPKPIESLAVLPVVTSASFIFICFGLSFQEVALALLGDDFRQWRPLKQFAKSLTGVLVVASTLFAFSSLAVLWFSKVSDLPPYLTEFALFPYRLGVILPALAVLHSMQRAILVNAGRNGPISRATAAEVITIASMMVVFSTVLPLPGVVAATVSIICGRIVSNAVLFFSSRRVIQTISQNR